MQHRVAYLRVRLETPGGSLPFVVASSLPDRSEAGAAFDGFDAWIINGAERIPVRLQATRASDAAPATSRIRFDHFGSTIDGTGEGADHDAGGPARRPRDFLRRGTLRVTRASGIATLALEAEPISDPSERFEPIPDAGAAADFAGRWLVRFSSSREPAIGVFEVDENQLATGTFLTTTGDYRFLAGRVDGDLLRLSAFDGAHAFLFHARLRGDGTLAGDFWSGNWWHETWTAARDAGARLPDAFASTRWNDGATLDDLVFADLDGRPRRVTDVLDGLGGTVRIVEVFGSWCPNCADAAHDLAALHRKYADRGLRVLGLAFELGRDPDEDAARVRRHAERHGAEWPVLIAGLSNKAKASAALPVLDRVRTYPTIIFLDAENRPLAIHAGYRGPATGQAHADMIAAFERLIEEHLDGAEGDRPAP